MSNILRRGRLEAAQGEEILHYTSSMEADRRIFEADIVVDLAHTVMLREQGIISTASIPRGPGLDDLLVAMGAEVRHGDTGTRRHGGARVPTSPRPRVPVSSQGEPLADLVVHASPLRATEAHGDLIVRAIDEFPIFAVAATQAEGTTAIREAVELRVKESDRIASVATELRKMGAHVEECPDGMLIRGPTRLHGAVVECHRDHRLAMALAVAGLAAEGPTEIRGAEAIGDSFPNFVEAMQALGADVAWSGKGGE